MGKNKIIETRHWPKLDFAGSGAVIILRDCFIQTP
jgi:hypothetical protein